MSDPNGNPTPTQDLDTELRRTVRRYHALRWWMTIAVGVLLIGTAIVGGYVVSQQQGELTASCALYHDLGQLQLHPTPPLHKVGQISVVIVIDARRAYIGQCSGPINPPTGSLSYWARYYHLPVPPGRD